MATRISVTPQQYMIRFPPGSCGGCHPHPRLLVAEQLASPGFERLPDASGRKDPAWAVVTVLQRNNYLHLVAQGVNLTVIFCGKHISSYPAI